ncbi:MAG: type I pullulanase [Erysipelotrichaceae bacterium]|nr:type I pullulanase [Erysipelotrichaceae bacterium]
MKSNTNMQAYLDDFGLINCYISKSFYSGKSDFFYLSNDDGYYKDCIVKQIEERKDNIKYQLIIPTDYEFGKEYALVCSLGVQTVVQVRFIVKNPLFDKLFTYTKSDLGSTYYKDKTDFVLWAPTATKVMVVVDNEGEIIAKQMQRSEFGVYRASVKGDLKRATYVYHVSVNGSVNMTSDPYGLSSKANGEVSAIIDLKEAFGEVDDIILPELKHNVDAIIYECSIKDMTSSILSGSTNHGYFESLSQPHTNYQGKSTGIDYLSKLSVTHVQFMPVNDFATVDELHKDRSYNWGYDPLQYFTLEGSYSANPNDPYDRIKQFKHLIVELHKRGIRVNLDVVYNHVYDIKMSSIDRCVPYYFFRYNDSGYLSNGSYCGNDIDSEKSMVRKYIIDNIKMWLKLYKVDGFRFDLMGLIDIKTMNDLFFEAKKINPSVMIYGEGWNMPTFLNDEDKSKIENNSKMPGIGHFNDYFRDSLKGKSADSERYDKGYLTGNYGMVYEMMSSLVGNSINGNYFQRFIDPNHSINYVEAHDNLTSWDKIKECCKSEIREIRMQRHKMLIACTIFAQGVPFIHSGQEFCRTKLLMGNTYNMGEDINKMDWERMAQNYDIVNYTKACILLRKELQGFRLPTSKEIAEKVSFKVLDNVVLEYNIRHVDKKVNINGIKVIINPTEYARDYTYNEDYVTLMDQSGYTIQAPVSKRIHIEPYSVVVCALL